MVNKYLNFTRCKNSLVNPTNYEKDALIFCVFYFISFWISSTRPYWNINECHDNSSNNSEIDSKVTKVCLFSAYLIQKLTFEFRISFELKVQHHD